VARRLGNRSTGIGFNQLAVILDCTDAEARLVFWNPDGSQLNACGSATRGVADILMLETCTRSVSLRTNRGLLQCERTSNADISVSMGEPLLEWQDIPLATQLDTLSLPIDGGPSACNMGNPHCPDARAPGSPEQVGFAKRAPSSRAADHPRC
jgi:diaminopimelate epimerase